MRILTHLKVKLKLFLLCFLFTPFVFVSCKHDEVYFKYNEILEGKWRGSDELIFKIDSNVLLPNRTYDFYLEVTNNTHYPYKNIWFYLKDNIESDSVFIESKLEYNLADDFGKWKGAGFASLYQTSFLVKSRFKIKESRDYTIRMNHGMHDEPLIGIEKIGIRIQPTAY